MKILFFTQIYPSSREPTRGPYNFSSFKALARHGEARVVSPRPWWGRLRRQPAELLRAPVENLDGMIASYPTYWSIPRYAPGLNGVMLYRSLRPHIARLRQEFPFDVVMAAWAYPDAAAAAMIAEEYGCPLVTRVMGSDVNHLGQLPETRAHVRVALQRSQRVVSVSGALHDRMVEMGVSPKRIVIVQNAVDGERFVPRDRVMARERLDLPGDRPIIGYVGRLSHEKGADVLIDAMGYLKAMGRSDLLLTIVGGGKLEAELRERASHLDLADQVRFCGEHGRDEVPLWHSACDVLCLPSRMEGCPNVVLEALASGRPVVASRVGGVPELLNETNGLMAPSEDPKALADALRAALDRAWDPQALRDTVAFLSWDDVGQHEWMMLQEMMEEWKGRARDEAMLATSAGR